MVWVEASLLARVVKALEAAQTKAGHLAQRVGHEHMGYCGWRTESPLCTEHRALVADVKAVLSSEDRMERAG